jgi:ElaB/YqjD/DUF883 family membrane-anchored ribosome-binding protein
MGETTGPMTPGDSTDEIRRDIAETQREMSYTIDEIQYRLSPAHLKDQAKESVRRAGLRTSRTVVERVRANPIGAAMVGVGLWMLMRDGDDRVNEYEIEFEPRFDEYEYGAGRLSGSERSDFYTTSAYSGRGRAAEMKDRASEAVDSAKEKISETADDVREGASHLAAEARQKAMDLKRRTRYGTHNLAMQSREMMMDSPLIAGVAAIALGAVIGAMLPETERENELFGEASDRLGQRVGEVAREGLDHARDIAGAAASAATSTAKREAEVAKDEMKQSMRSGDKLGR